MAKIEITDDQVLDAVRSVVEEEMPEAVRDAVLRHADTVIKEAVRKRIGPVVEQALENEQFVMSRLDDYRIPMDTQIKNAVVRYLDERVYLYSKTDERPSVRFSKSSSFSGEPTRLEAFLRFTVERYCDEHLANKLEPAVLSFAEKRGGIEQVAREQMAALLKEKFKL